MNRRFFYSTVVLFLFAIFFASCSGNSVKVSGAFHGKPNKMVYIEKLAPKRQVVDSVKTNSKGVFSYRYKMNPNNRAEFFNLRLEGGLVTLLVERGEKIKVNSIYNIAGGYNVEGSEGSQLIKDLNQSIVTTSMRIDSLYNLFNSVTDTDLRDQIGKEISSIYVKHKQNNITFLVQNNKSLASIMALYQQLPNGIVVFGENSDFPYYKMLADSLMTVFPNSLHVKTLLKDVERFENRVAFQNMVNSSLTSQMESAVPELIMKDMFGNEHKLTSLLGKVVLISFWSDSNKGSSLINSELKEIYSVYKDKGFEIYQISLDQSKQQWISAINKQGLPWISVNDFQGTASPALSSYNVVQLPANYLIGRDGDIIGRNLFGADLVETIAKQF